MNRHGTMKISDTLGCALIKSKFNGRLEAVIEKELLMSRKESLPSATPESVGIPSSAVTAFVRALAEHQLCLHSVLVFRHGKLAAEGYAPPFDAERTHRMYSISKSFTSLAVGLMLGEGRLRLTDRVIDYFPEYCPVPVHPLIAAATIRDMLTMCDCHDTSTHGFGISKNWLESWFAAPPSHPAGTVYAYNTTCTNLLCAIVEKLSGTTMMEYLYPRLLAPIGFAPGRVCIQTPDGDSFGGSGVLCTPRELARVALLCLNGGQWDGQQLIDEAYIRQATSCQVDNSLDNADIEHRQGYGYQIWRTRHNGFAFWGMGCQLAICLPDQDMVIVTTGDTQDTTPDTSIVMRTLWDTILPALSDGALPEDAAAHAVLTDTMRGLSLVTAGGAAQSPLSAAVSGKLYKLHPNEAGWRDVRFVFSGSEGRMVYTNCRGTKEIPFGFGTAKPFVFPETHYSGLRIGAPRGAGYASQASAGWVGGRTLFILCYLVDDHLGSLRVNAVFDGERITLCMKKTAEGFLDDYTGCLYGVYGAE